MQKYKKPSWLVERYAPGAADISRKPSRKNYLEVCTTDAKGRPLPNVRVAAWHLSDWNTKDAITLCDSNMQVCNNITDRMGALNVGPVEVGDELFIRARTLSCKTIDLIHLVGGDDVVSLQMENDL